MAEKKVKKCRVLNPRGIPKGIPIFGFAAVSWYEGDIFEPPKGFDADGRLLRDGFYEEMKDG